MLAYYKSLDGIRALAIALVFVQHFAFYIGKKINAGFLGVDLFFVLSGFLITGILINAQGSFGSSYKKFLGRRVLRIFPLYYGVLALMYIFNTEGTREWFVYLVTYTFNYATVYHDMPILPVSHFWSLAVEEQFYITWPLIVLFLRNRLQWLSRLMLLGMGLCVVHLVFNLFPSVTPYNFVGLFPRMLSLIMGGFAALHLDTIRKHAHILKHPMLEVLMWAGFIACMFIRTDLKIAIFPFVGTLLILKAVTGSFCVKWFARMLNHPRVGTIGKISYGMYIFHFPVGYYFSEWVFFPFWEAVPFEKMGSLAILEHHSYLVRFPVYSLLTISIAWLSYRYFEKPILRLKDRYFR